MGLSSSLPLSQFPRSSTISCPTWRNHVSVSLVVACGQKIGHGVLRPRLLSIPHPVYFSASVSLLTLICLPALALLLLRTRIPSGPSYLRPSVSLPVGVYVDVERDTFPVHK